MKLRIRDNSIRVRLTKTEVARLGQELPVEQTTRFSRSSALHCSIQPSRCAAAPSARFDGSTVTVALPAEQARQWASSDQVTIEAHQEIEPGTFLRILVEKDFQCMHSKAEG